MPVSQYARRATASVGALRIGTACFTGAALVSLGHAWGDETATRSWGPLAVCIVLAAVCAFSEVLVGGRSARQEERHLRAKLLTTYFHNSLRTHTGSASPAQQVTLMTDNAERMTEYRQVYLGATIAALAIPFLALGYVATIDPVLGFGIMAACPVVPLVVFSFLRLFRKVSASSHKERGRLTVQYLDALRNLIPIRLLSAGARTEARLRAQGETNRRAIMRLLAGNQVVIIVLDGAFSLLL
ncbi:MAG: ABC transporter transmembrane domain-containing protein, partial [Propionibacteriaceae bacterium]|nr:ABC transporter transmembrane domain-containing protein [Propionibacteriaceae bacterium]